MYGNSMCNLCQNLKNEDYRNIILELEKGEREIVPFTIFLIRFWFDNFLPIRNRCICTVFRDRFVSRADDLVYVDELLNTVGAPAGDTGDCEHRCKEFFRADQAWCIRNRCRNRHSGLHLYRSCACLR